MRSVAVVLALAGCNQVFDLKSTVLVDGAPDADLRPDRDHDGLADVIDPCIVFEDELAMDIDSDGKPNRTDGCPFTTGPDGDGDGVDDVCDPFPALAGDRHRCTMTFAYRELNATLWGPRPGEQEFAVATNYLLGPSGASSVAADPVVSMDGTITMDVAGGTYFPNEPFAFGVWISAGPTPSPADVACVVRGNGTQTDLLITAPVLRVSTAVPVPVEGGIYMRVVVQPSRAGTNLYCYAGHDRGDMLVTARIEPPLGNVGFLVPNGPALITTFIVYERDDTPAPL